MLATAMQILEHRSRLTRLGCGKEVQTHPNAPWVLEEGADCGMLYGLVPLVRTDQLPDVGIAALSKED